MKKETWHETKFPLRIAMVPYLQSLRIMGRLSGASTRSTLFSFVAA